MLLKNKLLLFISALIISSPILFGDETMQPDKRVEGWHKKVLTGPLQSEINKLKPNETLRLKKGLYKGPIHITVEGVTIEGEKGATITGELSGTVIVIEAPRVTIKGLKIIDSGLSYTEADSGIGIRSSNHVTLENNLIENCLFGIDVYSGSDITIQKNSISSKNLDVGLRGDAIRLWSVASSVIENNTWSYSRDVVAWYSNNLLFKGNHGSHSRYSIHSMYSEKLRIQGNVFKQNLVGIFLMYGNDFIITQNTIERALGSTGMGIGLKESSNIFAQNNIINYSAAGIMIDNSPFKPGSRNWFHGNKLTFNTKGVVLFNDRSGGEFKKNEFIGNLIDVDTDLRKGSQSKWIENKWDKYLGFDEDKNYIGDTPYIVRKYGDTIKGNNPKANFFFLTPLFSLIETIEEVTNLGEPIIVMQDTKPLLVN